MLITEAAAIINVSPRQMQRLAREKKLVLRTAGPKDRKKGAKANSLVLNGDLVAKLARERKRGGR